MINNEEKINIIKHKIETLDFMINSFIDHAKEFKDKYSLEDELSTCNAKKNALLKELTKLGGSCTDPLTNHG
jgi:hypothetical protein